MLRETFWLLLVAKWLQDLWCWICTLDSYSFKCYSKLKWPSLSFAITNGVRQFSSLDPTRIQLGSNDLDMYVESELEVSIGRVEGDMLTVASRQWLQLWHGVFTLSSYNFCITSTRLPILRLDIIIFCDLELLTKRDNPRAGSNSQSSDMFVKQRLLTWLCLGVFWF